MLLPIVSFLYFHLFSVVVSKYFHVKAVQFD